MNTKIEDIVTHTRPHFDEAAGVAVLRLYRPELVASANFAFMGIGRLSDQTEDEKQDGSVLCLGVLGGNADEHLPGREDECAATLVAKRYGIFGNPAVQVALRPVLRMDRAGAHADEIAAAMIHVARYAGIEDSDVFEWGILAASALIKEAEEIVAGYAPAADSKRAREPKVAVKTESVIFYVRKHFPDRFSAWAETLGRADQGRALERSEGEKLAKVAKVHVVGGRKVVVVEGTENREVANASRDCHRHDLVVVLRPSGLVQILTSGLSASGARKMNLLPLLADLRRAEMRARGLKELTAEEQTLPSTSVACPWWFGHLVDDGQRIGSVFNGTQDAALQAEPTKLSRDEVLGAVKAFVEKLAAAEAQPTERCNHRRGGNERRQERPASRGGAQGNGRHRQVSGFGGSRRCPSLPAGPRQPGIVDVRRAFDEAHA